MVSKILSDHAVASQIEMLTAWTESKMAYDGQPGISMAIVYDQELVWSKGFGFADVNKKRPATEDTLYRIASITKLFTNTAVLHLRDDGKLQLDDPITKHLPWFNIQNKFPDAPPITIRHLLTHTSGLPREAAFPYWTDNEFPTFEQIKEALVGQETPFPTETTFKYSNLALSLAGEIVTIVSGIDYTDYVQQFILDPLGMKDTLVNSPDPRNSRLATGYGRRMPDGSRAISPFTDGKGITPAGNMTTSVKDLAKFAMLQFRDGLAGGEQILRGSTLREMHHVQWLSPDWVTGIGLGFFSQRLKGTTITGHGGAVLGYRTLLRMSLTEKIATIVFMNADDGKPLLFADKVFEWVVPAILKAAKPEPKAKEPDPAWQVYVGKYRDDWGDSQTLVLNGELILFDPAEPEIVVKFESVAEHTFKIVSDFGFASIGELAVFEMDEDGNVKRLKVGENYSYPVAEW